MECVVVKSTTGKGLSLRCWSYKLNRLAAREFQYQLAKHFQEGDEVVILRRGERQ